MKIIVDLPGAHIEVFPPYLDVQTLRPPEVEEVASSLSPFAVPQFSLTSALCLYVYSFCRRLGLPAEFGRVVLHLYSNKETRQIDFIHIGMNLTPDISNLYRAALTPEVQQNLKLLLENPPRFRVDFQPVRATFPDSQHPKQ